MLRNTTVPSSSFTEIQPPPILSQHHPHRRQRKRHVSPTAGSSFFTRAGVAAAFFADFFGRARAMERTCAARTFASV